MLKIKRFYSEHKTGTVLGILLGVALVLLTITSERRHLNIKETGLSVFSVFQTGINQVENFFSRTFNSINELKKLKIEYDELQDKLSEYKIIERDLVELRQENKILREQLGFSREIGINHIPAEIIGKDPGNVFNTIAINRGSRHGVKKDMPVIAFQEGFQGLVGKVVSTGLFSSQVIPLYDSTCYVAARLQKSRYEGLVSGMGGLHKNLIMRYVKKRARAEIKYGDLVITSGMNSIYPKGIYIGRVRAVWGKTYETSLELEVESIIDFSKLEYVFILESGD